MPRGRPPQGDNPLSGAERQARYRARIEAQKTTAVVRYRRPADRRTRPQRWHDAVAELMALQVEYTAWAVALPDALQGTATADALQAIADFDLDELAIIRPPRDTGETDKTPANTLNSNQNHPNQMETLDAVPWKLFNAV